MPDQVLFITLGRPTAYNGWDSDENGSASLVVASKKLPLFVTMIAPRLFSLGLRARQEHNALLVIPRGAISFSLDM
jgi:hypothetical protein